MRESSTYQAILDEGRAEGERQGEIRGALDTLRELILDAGEDRFGVPHKEVIARIANIIDRDRLRRIARRCLTATDWSDLLSTP